MNKTGDKTPDYSCVIELAVGSNTSNTYKSKSIKENKRKIKATNL